MKQTIMKIGNSAGITIPKKLLKKGGLKIGDKVFVQANGGSELMTVYKDEGSVKSVSTEFLARAEKFIAKNRKLLKKLADE